MKSKMNWKYFIEGASTILKWDIKQQDVFKPTSEFVEEFFKRSLYYINDNLNIEGISYENENRIFSINKILHAINKITDALKLNLNHVLRPNKITIQAIQIVINYLFTFQEETYSEVELKIQERAEEKTSLQKQKEDIIMERLKIGMELGKLQLEVKSSETKLKTLDQIDLDTQKIQNAHTTEMSLNKLDEAKKGFDLKSKELFEMDEYINKCSKTKTAELTIKEHQLIKNENLKIIREITEESDILNNHMKQKIQDIQVVNGVYQKNNNEFHSNIDTLTFTSCMLKNLNQTYTNSKESIKSLQNNINTHEENNAILLKNRDDIKTNVDNVTRKKEIDRENLIISKNHLKEKIQIQSSTNVKLIKTHKNLSQAQADTVKKRESLKEDIKKIVHMKNMEIQKLIENTSKAYISFEM